jgi:Tol biopolymer transport system component
VIVSIIIGALVAGVLLSRVFLPSGKSGASTAPPAYTVLTSDSGLSFEPAISRDGKLVVYASDRAGEGNLDIWVRQLPDGYPVRVTNDKADDREPDFSPDGSKIVFRSDRGGGGLYIMSPFGAGLRKIVDGGRSPHFSPDGKWIVYWTGERHQGLVGRIWIISATGGEPKEITPIDSGGEDPIWAPDSKGVIVLGRSGPMLVPPRPEWLYLPIDGSKATICVTTSELESFGLSIPPLQSFLRPAAFVENSIVFAARSGGHRHCGDCRYPPRRAVQTDGPFR